MSRNDEIILKLKRLQKENIQIPKSIYMVQEQEMKLRNTLIGIY
jgi:hypothetical protein